MQTLYKASVASPFGGPGLRPSRIPLASIAWSSGDDLIAVISGCGAAAVYHVDSPGEASMLVAPKKAPARLLAWRPKFPPPQNSDMIPAPNYLKSAQKLSLPKIEEALPVLLVADAASIITLWSSKDFRTNVWEPIASVECDSTLLSIGWTRNGSIIAAITALGTIYLFSVDISPNGKATIIPVLPFESTNASGAADSNNNNSNNSNKNKTAHSHFKANSNAVVVVAAAAASAESKRKTSSLEKKRGALTEDDGSKGEHSESSVMSQELHTTSTASLGGPLRCASIAPGGLDENSVAILSVLSSSPDKVDVWHVYVPKQVTQNAKKMFQMKILGNIATNVECVACQAAPPAGAVFIWDQEGVISRWVFTKKKQGSSEGEWIRTANSHSQDTSQLKNDQNHIVRYNVPVTVARPSSVVVSQKGDMVITADVNQGIRILDGKSLVEKCRVDLADTPSSVWALAMSPSGVCLLALAGDGIVYTYAITKHLRTPQEIVQKLTESANPSGKRGAWDILALLSVSGKEFAVALVQSLTAKPTPKTDTLRLTILSAVDHETYTVTSARILLDLAIDAIKMTCPSQITDLIVSTGDTKPLDMGVLTKSENIITECTKLLNDIPYDTNRASVYLVDWIITLTAVWIRRVVLTVIRRLGTSYLDEVWWSNDCSNPSEIDNRTSIIQDFLLTKTLRGVGLAAVTILLLEETYNDRGREPRYLRFTANEAADIVALLWQISSTMETASDKKNEAVAAALNGHVAAAKAISGCGKLNIDMCEKALGMKGNGTGAGFILSRARHLRGIQGSPDDPEWCPYDIITGSELSPWMPLRRCTVSGLISAEINAGEFSEPRCNVTHPWAEKWSFESPFGGLWARIPSLDLDRFDLFPSGHEKKPSVNDMQGAERYQNLSLKSGLSTVPVQQTTKSECTEATNLTGRSVRGVKRERSKKNKHEVIEQKMPEAQSQPHGPSQYKVAPTNEQSGMQSGNFLQSQKSTTSLMSAGSSGGKRKRGGKTATPRGRKAQAGENRSEVNINSMQLPLSGALQSMGSLGSMQNIPLSPAYMGSQTPGTPGQYMPMYGQMVGNFQNNGAVLPPQMGSVPNSVGTMQGQIQGRMGTGNFTSPGQPGMFGNQQRIPNQGIGNSSMSNHGMIKANMSMSNPGMTNTSVSNPGMANTSVSNPGMANTSMSNPSMANTSMSNPGIVNISMPNQAMINVSMQSPMMQMGKINKTSTSQMPNTGIPNPQHSVEAPSNSRPNSSTMINSLMMNMPGTPQNSVVSNINMAPPSILPGAIQNLTLRIWQGKLHVRGNKNDMIVTCVAYAQTSRNRTPLRDASGWPSELTCDSSSLKPTGVLWPQLDDPASQWYARLIPVDEEGNEIVSAKLLELVKVMVQRKLTFEIECRQNPRNPGKLYLWGMDIQGTGLSMLAVFRPEQTEVINDGDVNFLDSILQ